MFNTKETDKMYVKEFRFHILLTVLLFCCFSTLYLQHSFAQNYTQMSLPEGAKARLGKGIIKDILYSPDGNLFVVVSSIGLWLYDTTEYQEITLLPIPKSLDRALAHRIQNTNFSVDGEMLICETEEKQAIIWDVSTQEYEVVSLANRASFSTDRQSFTFGISGKEPIELWQGKKENIEKPEKRNGGIDIITTYSPNGQTLATVVDEYNIMIKDKRTQNLSKFYIKFPKFKYHQNIYLSPDGQTLATLNSNSPIHLWDIETGKLKRTLVGYLAKSNPNRIQTRYNPSSQIDSVTFSPDGKVLANGSLNGEIRLWDINSGKIIRKFTEQFGFIKSLSFSPDGRFLASGSDDGSILVWDIETGKHEPFLAERMQLISCVSFSHDGRMLVGGSVYGDIYLFDVETRDTIKTFTGHIAEIYDLMFSPDNSQIASVGWDGTVRLWDIETRKQIKCISAPISVHFWGYWREILFTENGILFAINNDYGDFIHLWNVNTGEYLQVLMGHASHLRSYSVNANKKTLASYSADGTILLWDLSSKINAIH